jgi:hypothetical protein
VTQDVNICGTDIYEANPNSANAKLINLGEPITALICSNAATADLDWFKFTVTSNTLAGTKVRIDLTSLPADYDLYLHTGDSRPIATSLKRGTISESIEKVLQPGTYFAKVIGFAGTEHTHDYYQLSIKNLGDVITTQSTPADDNARLDNVVVYPNPVSNGTLHITLDQPLQELTPQVQLFESMGNEVSGLRYDTQDGDITVDTRSIKKGMYTLRISVGEKVTTKRIVIE